MIQPTAGHLPRRRPRHHCRRLVGQVEDSGHGMGHAARGPNSVESRAVEVIEALGPKVQALVEEEEFESLRKTPLVVDLAMLKQS